MDVSLSAKPQTLTLISCFRSSSSSSRLFPLQREFLGCDHRLRPPGLCSRRKRKKWVFQIQSPRFLIRASLYSQPIYVIIAVVTFSALIVFYLNYTRRKKDVNKLSSPKDLESLEMSKPGRGLLKQGIEAWISDLGKLNAETPMIELQPITVQANEKGHASVEREGQCLEMALVHEETRFAKASESTGSGVLASSASGAVSMEEKEGVLEPVTFTKEMPELLLDGHQVEAVLGSKSNGQMAELASIVAAIPVDHANDKTIQDKKPGHIVDEASDLQVSDYNGIFRESVREELYMFYEDNQSGMKSISNLRDLKTVPSLSLAHNKRFSSQLRTNMLNGAEHLAQGSHHTSGKMPHACYKEHSSRKREDSSKDGKFQRDKGKRLLSQNGQRDCPILPRPNGSHANNNHDPSEYINAYNRLLRNGRLTDCMELLESVEQKGLLDMDKIYHVKFFNTCKSQKAVKEAFRFIKLIGNPTLSTFNMLLSVCASSQDQEGAFQVLELVKEAGLKADCKLYTTLISTCAKSGKVDAMFEVFHEMVNAGVEPNVHTYGALIDGCARAGQVAKAFGAYGILRSKNVKPDRVIFNALITACGQSGAVDRAFDVLAEMRAEPTPIDPDHFTVGALIKTCTQAGQFDRAREVYEMIHQYKIKGTPEVYTIAVNSCSQMGDLDFALKVYDDMTRNGVVPDEMFLSALVDVAGHAGKIDVAFKILQEARVQGKNLGNISYSSLMGACSNAKNWQKAMELYEDIKAIKLRPTVSMLNALLTALCDGGQLQKAVEVLAEMRKIGVHPNIVTYSILLVASEKNDELELGLTLHSQAKKDDVIPNFIMYKCLIGICLQRFEKAYSLGECVLSFNSGKPQIDNKWTSLALTVYREAIAAGITPTMEVFSLVLACLQFPRDSSTRARLVDNLGVNSDSSKCSNLYSLIDGFGEYDPRSFSIFEEAASLGIVPCVSFRDSPIVVDTRKLQIHTTEVYLLTILKCLKHRLAAGAKLPNLTIILPIEKTQTSTDKGGKTMKLAGRVGQAVGALLRRLGLLYQGNESYGKIRINGLALKRWLQPKLASPFSGIPAELNSSQMRLGKRITDQQRNIRTSHLSLE